MDNELKKPMTKKGFLKLSKEYNHLFNEIRPQVVQGIADAAAEGDRSENAEYIYGKKRLRELDKRLKYLTYLLKEVQVIDTGLIKSDKVCFGSTVTLRDEDGSEKRWMIVGEGESDSAEGTISWKSPVARAVLGKAIGQVVLVELPEDDKEIEIVALEFEER